MPENGGLDVVRAHAALSPRPPLVVVGDAAYAADYGAAVRRAAAPEVVTTTGPNGDYSATVALPAPVAPATTATYSLTASVDQANRKSGKGKRARKHVCSALTSAPASVTVS